MIGCVYLVDEIHEEIEHKIAKQDVQEMRGELCPGQDSIYAHTDIEYVCYDEHDQSIYVDYLLIFFDILCHLFDYIVLQLGLFHVVDCHTETEEEQYVSYRVEQHKPRVLFAIEHTDHVQQNTQGEKQEDLLRARIHVRMSRLIQFDCHDHSNHIHEARVELKVIKARTHVIGRAEYSLHDQTDSHCVKEAKVLRYSVSDHNMWILLAYVGVRVGALLDHYDKHNAE